MIYINLYILMYIYSCIFVCIHICIYKYIIYTEFLCMCFHKSVALPPHIMISCHRSVVIDQLY